MVSTLLGVLGSAALLIGLAIATIGLYGLLRRQDIFAQLHAAGLLTGPAVILVLIASIASARTATITSALLVVAFVLVTGSLSTHAIALAAWRRRFAPPTSGGEAPGVHEADRDLDDRKGPGAFRVVLGHDGSTGADVAVRLIAGLEWPIGSVVRVIAVEEGDVSPLASATDSPRSAPGSREATTALESARAVLAAAGLEVESERRGGGDPVAVLLDEAVAIDADLLVVGTRGLGPLRSLLAGTVGGGLVGDATCPVLIARSDRVERVLLATDGSPASDTATRIIARWPAFAGLPIEVLSVAGARHRYGRISAAGGLREAVDRLRHQRIADAAATQLRHAGRLASPHVRIGDAEARILTHAERGSIDLIVVGSSGRRGLRRALVGSVAQAVLTATGHSVLIVPRRRR